MLSETPWQKPFTFLWTCKKEPCIWKQKYNLLFNTFKTYSKPSIMAVVWIVWTQFCSFYKRTRHKKPLPVSITNGTRFQHILLWLNISTPHSNYIFSKESTQTQKQKIRVSICGPTNAKGDIVWKKKTAEVRRVDEGTAKRQRRRLILSRRSFFQK